MSKRVNLVDQQFGRLTVVCFAGTDKRLNALWECRCTCGNKVTVRGFLLKNGDQQSCGCLNKESNQFQIGDPGPSLKHGLAHRIPEHHVWLMMHQRCKNPNRKEFKNYGGRGIKVCERWSGKQGFENFLADMGRRPEGKLPNGRALYSIDRFPDLNGNYEPSNCRWTTSKEQNNNRRPRRKAA